MFPTILIQIKKTELEWCKHIVIVVVDDDCGNDDADGYGDDNADDDVTVADVDDADDDANYKDTVGPDGQGIACWVWDSYCFCFIIIFSW